MRFWLWFFCLFTKFFYHLKLSIHQSLDRWLERLRWETYGYWQMRIQEPHQPYWVLDTLAMIYPNLMELQSIQPTHQPMYQVHYSLAIPVAKHSTQNSIQMNHKTNTEWFLMVPKTRQSAALWLMSIIMTMLMFLHSFDDMMHQLKCTLWQTLAHLWSTVRIVCRFFSHAPERRGSLWRLAAFLTSSILWCWHLNQTHIC